MIFLLQERIALDKIASVFILFLLLLLELVGSVSIDASLLDTNKFIGIFYGILHQNFLALFEGFLSHMLKFNH